MNIEGSVEANVTVRIVSESERREIDILINALRYLQFFKPRKNASVLPGNNACEIFRDELFTSSAQGPMVGFVWNGFNVLLSIIRFPQKHKEINFDIFLSLREPSAFPCSINVGFG